MANVVEKYQLAGLDERERGFNRLVEVERVNELYRARFQYETTMLMAEARDSTGSALSDLIRLLQGRGYTQLRSQLSFRGGTYLGTVEGWLEHPDLQMAQHREAGTLRRLWSKMTAWLTRTPSVSG
jgi:hypothetical protein